MSIIHFLKLEISIDRVNTTSGFNCHPSIKTFEGRLLRKNDLFLKKESKDTAVNSSFTERGGSEVAGV
jgi:hypothetical protein